jgi:hypothetical protein
MALNKLFEVIHHMQHVIAVSVCVWLTPKWVPLWRINIWQIKTLALDDDWRCVLLQSACTSMTCHQGGTVASCLWICSSECTYVWYLLVCFSQRMPVFVHIIVPGFCIRICSIGHNLYVCPFHEFLHAQACVCLYVCSRLLPVNTHQ